MSHKFVKAALYAYLLLIGGAASVLAEKKDDKCKGLDKPPFTNVAAKACFMVTLATNLCEVQKKYDLLADALPNLPPRMNPPPEAELMSKIGDDNQACFPGSPVDKSAIPAIIEDPCAEAARRQVELKKSYGNDVASSCAQVLENNGHPTLGKKPKLEQSGRLFNAKVDPVVPKEMNLACTG
jgi:hypothetical protein